MLLFDEDQCPNALRQIHWSCPTCRSMKLTHCTRTKRTTASLMLLVWLFAFVSGVAHACLLDSGEEGLSDTVATFSHSFHGHAGTATHEGQSDDTDDEFDVLKSCLKACDDGSRSLPSYICGVDLTDPGIANPLAVLWTAPSQDVEMSERLGERQPLPPGQPVRTRYSRLAL